MGNTDSTKESLTSIICERCLNPGAHPSLNCVSSEMLKHPDKVKKLGITLGNQKDNKPFVTAIFPKGWTCENNKEDDRIAIFYNEKGIPKLRMCIYYDTIKDDIKYNFSYVEFYSDKKDV